MLELSKAVQRVIDVERKACEKLREELAVAKAALTAMEYEVPAAKVTGLALEVCSELPLGLRAVRDLGGW